MNWQIEKHLKPTNQPLPPSKDLGFGKYFADHYFSTKFVRGKGWFDAKIEPYADFAIDPAACALHYGQALFEGLKAFRQDNGKITVFNPDFNWKRMAAGADRLCMEMPPLDLWDQGLHQLLAVCERFVPMDPGTALYIRPTLIATEGFLGVRPSNEYLFYIILSPVGAYYAEGRDPVRIWVEKEFVRAAPGGIGMTKAAANYAGSLKAALNAKAKNYSQVLWLDVTRTYVEEVGTMNVFFVFGSGKNAEIATPSLDGTILEGGTRQASIQLLRDQGHKVVERKIAWKEIVDASNSGTLTEAFGTGTAAVISPIGQLDSEDHQLKMPPEGPIATSLYNEITGIQYGRKPDRHGWLKEVRPIS